ncbi:MAG: DUF3368 domain-containing protein [Coleofasciculaceae cyanobacterium SM2_1_6]|nr:DUF3368 domain-containing protein [Coleofasciculaceae cyanobacterium SM2_1_6]
MIVVSDTSPICYLLLIDQIEILPTLYQVIIISQAVVEELSAANSPSVVKKWIALPPDWLQIQSTSIPQALELEKLDRGEREAIFLAEQQNADLVILDDKAARRLALGRSLRIIGLLGILKDAAQSNLIDLAIVFAKLREVGFWVEPSLLERLLRDN